MASGSINGRNTGVYSNYSATSPFDANNSRSMHEEIISEYEYVYKFLKRKQKDLAKAEGEDRLKLEEQLNRVQRALDKKAIKQEEEDRIKMRLEELKVLKEQGMATEAEIHEYRKTQQKELLKEWGKGLGKQLTSQLTQAGTTAIEDYIKVFSTYTSAINTRLFGTGQTFAQFNKDFQRNLATSPYVKQTEVIANLSKLVSEGTAYNLEQRAFLATISDKIATTFDSFNSSLLQIIRIQQADTTVARLGMEASLTEYLNRRYSDTSYLSGTATGVTEALFPATSLMGYQPSVEFEYVVQKWLGSLGSLGVSGPALTKIAQGIGYLGSGDVSKFSSDQATQNLLTIAASRAGLNIADLMSGGLTTAKTNQLLQSLVQYSAQLANTSNMVARAQYADIFGYSMSDMAALMKITADDLSNISSNMLTYRQLEGVTSTQLSTVGSRMYYSEFIDNVISNVLSGVGSTIASNPLTYGLWELTSMTKKATGGIPIPTIGALGTFVDLNATVEDLVQTGLVGVGVIGEVVKAFSSIGKQGGLSLNIWNAKNQLTRGTGESLISVGADTSKSLSQYYGGGGEDIQAATIAGATEEAKTITASEDDQDTRNSKEAMRILATSNWQSSVGYILDEIRDIKFIMSSNSAIWGAK